MDVSPLCHKCHESQTVVEGQGRFTKCGLTAGDTIYNVNATPNLGRYEASLEVVPLPWKACNHGMYCLECEWGISHGLIPMHRQFLCDYQTYLEGTT